MKILLTGAKGQVGREIVERVGSAYPDTELHAYSRAELDISNLEQVAKAVLRHRPKVLINAAGYTQVDKAEAEQKEAYLANCEGVKNLAVVCKEHDIPLLHLSTDYVFDGEQELPYCEEDPRSPKNIYGASKAEGELALQSIWEKHVILRVSWVFGQYGHNFVKTVLRLSEEKKELRVVDDQRGCPTPASEIAATLLDLAAKVTHKDPAWGIYHYRGDKAVSWYQFANAILKHKKTGSQPKLSAISTAEFPTPAKRPKNSVMNVDKIRETYGIAPANWEQALIEVLERIHEAL